jgi:hypothetical protein
MSVKISKLRDPFLPRRGILYMYLDDYDFNFRLKYEQKPKVQHH